MAHNNFYGYTPKASNEKEGNRLDRLNPYEFKKGMDYELVNMGIYRLAESSFEDREEATEKVIKNLQEYGGYYSALIQYETLYRNPIEGQSKPSFKAYLQEIEDYQMIEVDKTYSYDKMVEPKYKKEDYTIPFKTGEIKNFKLKALKEAIKKEIKKAKEEDEFDVEDREPTSKEIRGIDKSIGDTKEALAQAIKKVKELGPDIKKLAKETNDKIKKNPAGKEGYLQTYTTNPDVKEFIKLRKMLKSADLLNEIMNAKQLKRLIRQTLKEIQGGNQLNENIVCNGWFDCPPCGGGVAATCKKDGVEVNSTDAGGTCGCGGKLSTDNRGGKSKSGGCTGNFTQGSCPPGQCCIGGSCGGCRDNPAGGKSKFRSKMPKNEADQQLYEKSPGWKYFKWKDLFPPKPAPWNESQLDEGPFCPNGCPPGTTCTHGGGGPYGNCTPNSAGGKSKFRSKMSKNETDQRSFTSSKKKICCKDSDGVITSSINGICPKSSTKVSCKGTPPTQGTITTENYKTNKMNKNYLKQLIKEEIQQLNEKWRINWKTLYSNIKSLIGWWNLLNSWDSDSRLKKNIKRVSTSPSGIPIYEFEYKNPKLYGGGVFRGVLAEQAPKKAVITATNGYKMVNYSLIDVAFERVNEQRGIRPVLDWNMMVKLSAPGMQALRDIENMGPDELGPGNSQNNLNIIAGELANFIENVNNSKGQYIIDNPGTLPQAKKIWWAHIFPFIECDCPPPGSGVWSNKCCTK
jgi:hypothetical protein